MWPLKPWTFILIISSKWQIPFIYSCHFDFYLQKPYTPLPYNPSYSSLPGPSIVFKGLSPLVVPSTCKGFSFWVIPSHTYESAQTTLNDSLIFSSITTISYVSLMCSFLCLYFSITHVIHLWLHILLPLPFFFWKVFVTIALPTCLSLIALYSTIKHC